MKTNSTCTTVMIEGNVTRSESISICVHCGSEVITIYEKDDTPGFRSKDEWEQYSCDCRHYEGKSSKEVFEILTREYKKEVEYYKSQYEKLRRGSVKLNENMQMGLDLLKCYMFDDILLCDNCGEEHDKSDFAVCNECGDYMCKSCIENIGASVENYVCEACVDNDDY